MIGASIKAKTTVLVIAITLALAMVAPDVSAQYGNGLVVNAPASVVLGETFEVTGSCDPGQPVMIYSGDGLVLLGTTTSSDVDGSFSFASLALPADAKAGDRLTLTVVCGSEDPQQVSVLVDVLSRTDTNSDTNSGTVTTTLARTGSDLTDALLKTAVTTMGLGVALVAFARRRKETQEVTAS